MAADDVLIDTFLEENIFVKMEFINRKEGPSAIVKQRKKFGEFTTLYENLRSHGEKFYEYTRMSVSTFDYILKKIEPRLNVMDTNFHITIRPAEKLIVTLRLVKNKITEFISNFYLKGSCIYTYYNCCKLLTDSVPRLVPGSVK